MPHALRARSIVAVAQGQTLRRYSYTSDAIGSHLEPSLLAHSCRQARHRSSLLCLDANAHWHSHWHSAQLAVRSLQSAVCSLLSAVCCLLSVCSAVPFCLATSTLEGPEVADCHHPWRLVLSSYTHPHPHPHTHTRSLAESCRELRAVCPSPPAPLLRSSSPRPPWSSIPSTSLIVTPSASTADVGPPAYPPPPPNVHNPAPASQATAMAPPAPARACHMPTMRSSSLV